VIVHEDTFPTAEQQFIHSAGNEIVKIDNAIEGYSRELKDSLGSPTLALKPAWTAELLRRLKAQGVTIEPRFAAAGERFIGDRLARRTAIKAFGDGVAKQLMLGDDPQLERALALLKKSSTQAQLLASAQPR